MACRTKLSTEESTWQIDGASDQKCSALSELATSFDSPVESKTLHEDSNPSLQGLFHYSDLFSTFRGLILQLWMLWELLLIGELILIIAPTPPQCCEVVAGLVSLIAPLLCSVDFRPYFTIHNPDFARLNSLREFKSRGAAEQEQHKVWRQARMNAVIQQLTSKMSEVE